MFVRTTIIPKSTDRHVYLVEGYRDKGGKQKQRILKKFGLLSILTKNNPNALQELKQKYKNIKTSRDFKLDLNWKQNLHSATPFQNYGYFFLDAIYNELGINKFIKEHSKKYDFKYDLNSILRLLVFNRILNPSSKLDAFNNQHKFFEPFENKLNDIYRSLSVMNEIKDDLQVQMHEQILDKYNRDCTLVLYDVTNYYFETEKEDELKKLGCSKENKKSPIVQTGLMIDKNKIPIGYKLFSGNTHDSKTVVPMIDDLKKKFKINKVIFTADKGINSAKNLGLLVSKGNGYIVSQKIRGSSKTFIEEVLNEPDYTYWGNDFKFKEVFRNRTVKTPEGNDIELKEKLVIFWSKNYDNREKRKREKLAIKIDKFISSPSTLKSSNSHGIKRYLKTIKVDQKTGEVLKGKDQVIFDEVKYQRDVNLDGYYCIVTSELDKPIKEILSSYRELWKIEESFKVIKSDLSGRPVYVRRNDRVEGHFLTCFIALTILRLLEYKLKFKYSTSKIKQDLNEAICKEFTSGIYTNQSHGDSIIDLENLYFSYLRYETTTVEEMRKYRKGFLT